MSLSAPRKACISLRPHVSSWHLMSDCWMYMAWFRRAREEAEKRERREKQQRLEEAKQKKRLQEQQAKVDHFGSANALTIMAQAASDKNSDAQL